MGWPSRKALENFLQTFALCFGCERNEEGSNFGQPNGNKWNFTRAQKTNTREDSQICDSSQMRGSTLTWPAPFRDAPRDRKWPLASGEAQIVMVESAPRLFWADQLGGAKFEYQIGRRRQPRAGSSPEPRQPFARPLFVYVIQFKSTKGCDQA